MHRCTECGQIEGKIKEFDAEMKEEGDPDVICAECDGELEFYDEDYGQDR